MYTKRKNERMAYGIVGLGHFGYALAMELARSGAELLVIDRDEEKVGEIREITENAIVLKTLDKKALMETGIQNCDVAVVCIGEHMDTSILTTLYLVGMGIPTVISKATSPEHGEILEKLGAEVVYPARDVDIRLARRLGTSRMLDFIELSEQINITKMLVPEQFIGKMVKDIEFRPRFGLNIIAIENNNIIMENIKPEYLFCKNDILIIAGSREGLFRLSEWAEKNC